MRVKVIKPKLETSREGIINHDMSDFLTIGDEFIVYAMTIQKQLSYFQIYIEKKLFSVPLDLFEIIDPRVSQYWLISYEALTLRFWPKEFFIAYFHDDLFEQVPEIVKQFEEVRRRIENEW